MSVKLILTPLAESPSYLALVPKTYILIIFSEKIKLSLLGENYIL